MNQQDEVKRGEQRQSSPSAASSRLTELLTGFQLPGSSFALMAYFVCTHIAFFQPSQRLFWEKNPQTGSSKKFRQFMSTVDLAVPEISCRT